MYSLVPSQQDILKLEENKLSSHHPFLTGLAALASLFLNLSFIHNSGVLMWMVLIKGV
jgi:hypothetical protein